MTYAKLTDGVLIYAPKTYRTDNEVIFNFTDCPAIMLSHGFYPIVGDPPQQIEGKMAVPHYTQEDPVGTIVTRSYTDEITGEEVTYEETVYNMDHPQIRVTYTYEDIITDEGDMGA